MRPNLFMKHALVLILLGLASAAGSQAGAAPHAPAATCSANLSLMPRPIRERFAKQREEIALSEERHNAKLPANQPLEATMSLDSK